MRLEIEIPAKHWAALEAHAATVKADPVAFLRDSVSRWLLEIVKQGMKAGLDAEFAKETPDEAKLGAAMVELNRLARLAVTVKEVSP